MSFDGHPRFSPPRIPVGARLALCVLMSMALLLADAHFNLSSHVKKITDLPLLPMHWLSNKSSNLLSFASDSLKNNIQLQKENQLLKKQNLAQSAAVARLNTIESELSKLKKLVGITHSRLNTIGVAEVINTGNDPFVYRLNISGMQIKNFKVGQPVLDEKGLLGIITSVQTIDAEVTLAVNKGFMIPVILERTGERSILYGYGGGVNLPYFPQSSDIRVGDRLVSSGLDSIYPSGLPIASITAVNKNPNAQFAKVRCKTLAGMRSSRYVLVIAEAKNNISKVSHQPLVTKTLSRPSNADKP